jgi:hypothetical protein
MVVDETPVAKPEIDFQFDERRLENLAKGSAK